MTVTSDKVTALLIRWSEGDDKALQQLIPFVERELHRIAHRYMRRETPGHILQTSALVNELYLKLVDQTRVQWRNRAHFFAIAAQLMRRILIDHARTRNTAKRGGAVVHLSVSDKAETSIVSIEKAAELISLDKALNKLAKIDKRKAQIVEMRYFGGLSVEETAEVMRLSSATVMRHWTFAKSWLRYELHHGR